MRAVESRLVVVDERVAGRFAADREAGAVARARDELADLAGALLLPPPQATRLIRTSPVQMVLDIDPPAGVPSV
jgi:hypothetical protein